MFGRTVFSSAGVKCILHKTNCLVIHFYSGKQKKMKGVDCGGLEYGGSEYFVIVKY